MLSFCVGPDMTQHYHHQNRIHLFFTMKHEGTENSLGLGISRMCFRCYGKLEYTS